MLAVQDTSQELRVAAFGSPLPESERRAVERFDAVGAAELTIGDDVYHGRLTDISVLGAGLDVASPGPGDDPGGRAGRPRRLRRAAACDARPRRLPPPARRAPRVRIGVEFADARGVADATRRLIDQLNTRAYGRGGSVSRARLDATPCSAGHAPLDAPRDSRDPSHRSPT